MIDLQVQKQLRGASGDMNMQVKIQIPKGQLACLYGKSGAGKTSILRMIAGLASPDQGTITVDDTTWVDTRSATHIPIQDRNIGFVFQEYSLFPNMTVRGNLEFALHKKQHPKIITDLLDIMELGGIQQQRPQQLSGGQQQRVALARALVQQPKILLLDEPLSALDHGMRATLQKYIRTVHQEYQLTTLLISHDVPEILKMASYVYHIDQGQVIQEGTPLHVFDLNTPNPHTPYIGEIIEVHHRDSKVHLIVLLGKNSMTIYREMNANIPYKIGDDIEINALDFKTSLGLNFES